MAPVGENVQRRAIGVDPFSLTAVRLTMMRGDLELAFGSGTLWRAGPKTCLVTAWHCLTGTHPITREALSKKTAARPDRVKITMLLRSSAQVVEFFQFLYTDDEGEPGWYVHQLGSREIDLAVIPLAVDIPPEVINTTVDTVPQTEDMAVQVGCDLFILGFPRNLARLNLPIWKRASLAIDPSALIDDNDGRHFLVDSATREGLSGGIVIARRYGSYQAIGGPTTMGGGTYTKVVGIYSGRVGSEDEFAAQIGIVWPVRYVEEIIASGKLDDFV